MRIRVVANQPTKLTYRLFDEATGALADTSGGNVSVSVKRPDGTEVLPSTAMTAEAAAGIYTWTLPAQAQLDDLEATIVVTGSLARTDRQVIRVIGHRLVPLWKLKAEPDLAHLTGEEIARLADKVEEWFRNAVGFPVVPEPIRVSFRAPAHRRLILPGVWSPIELYAVSQAGTAVTISDLVPGANWIAWADNRLWTANAEVVGWLTHGVPDADADLVDAALTFARYAGRKPDKHIPARATRMSSQDADFLLSLPDPDKPTGIPDVDIVIKRLKIDLPLGV